MNPPQSVRFGMDNYYQHQLRIAKESIPVAFRNADDPDTYNQHLADGLIALTRAVEEIGGKLNIKG